MADALISPAVGGTMWVATTGLIGYSAHKIREEIDDRKVPLMGVMAAFVFAAQMINFTIPATGSSGHLGGGLILAILLGPYSAFLTIASVLTVQALFFADGGLLALGCNIFNLGVFPCFIAYPLIFKPIAGNQLSRGRIITGSILAAIAGLQIGAFAVVLETVFSGIAELPFNTFILLMLPIHMAIGLVEGLVTASVVFFLWNARPEILDIGAETSRIGSRPLKSILIALAVVTLVTGSMLSWFASTHPDGLEWSMFKTSGKEELESSGGLHESLASLQGKTAFLPDYGFKAESEEAAEDMKQETETEEAWPAVNGGTSLSGLVGSALTLILALLVGFALKRRHAHLTSPQD